MNKENKIETNNEVLLRCLAEAKKKGLTNDEALRAYDRTLKNEFPNMGYDLSTLYKKEEESE